MIVAIRIRGQVKINQKQKDTLYRLRLRRKYACVVLQPTKENIGMIKKMRDFVAYGEIDEKTLEELISKRGVAIDKTKELEAKKVAEALAKGTKPEKINLKPFFRLHPPRGGIKSKLHFPKGVLGNHGKEINKLIERML